MHNNMYDTTHSCRDSCSAAAKFGDQNIQMLPCVVQCFPRGLWIFSAIFVTTIILSSPFVRVVQAQELQELEFSTNPDDYDFGWFAIGVYEQGSVPYCTYCVNALDPDDYDLSTAGVGATNGPFWNRTVALCRCDGVDPDEMWAYHESTSSIVFSNLTTGPGPLCIDALLWDSDQVLKLRQCNSSVATQIWTMEGNRFVNGGLVDSDGHFLYMVGETPNKDTTNPSDQKLSGKLYTYYPLVINSSIPNNLFGSAAYSYVTNFTFLSTINLVDKSMDRFTTQGLLQITNSSRDQVVNGDFESSTIQARTEITWSSWVQNEPSYLALCGWVIDTGPIDYVESVLLQAANGSSRSIHLNTHSDADHWGSISQTFLTEAGREYVLSFCFNGFPPNLTIDSRPNWQCSSSYHEAQLQVGVTNSTSSDRLSGALSDGNGFTQDFTFDVSSSNVLNIGKLWELQIVIFTASTNVTTISFTSLNFNDSCGPMIDEVSVSPLEPPSAVKNKFLLVICGSIAGLAILIAGLGVTHGIRYCRAQEEKYSGLLIKTDDARLYSVKELSISTKKFSSVLGEGGFGTVYKAEFPNGTSGAVKVERRQPGRNNSSTKALASDEIAVLLRARHRNLVNLIGFCIHKGQHMLVFEYLPNGSLYGRLHQSILHSSGAAGSRGAAIDPNVDKDQRSPNVLSWKQRVKIIADVASGLDYLHNEADPPIVHGDVKSHNILLTATDSAKLADFGLSNFATRPSGGDLNVNSRGSIGYLDPQYLLNNGGVLSAKSDVYSFGVVVLELISGHPAIYNAAPLAAWAAPFMASPSLYKEMVDKKLNGEFDALELESVVDLSRMCMHEDSRMRPSMRQLVAFLKTKKLANVCEVSEWMEETKSRELQREVYQKMNPMFIDFEANSAPDSYASSSSEFLPVPLSSTQNTPPFLHSRTDIAV